jgi:hypothetical protein
MEKALAFVPEIVAPEIVRVPPPELVMVRVSGEEVIVGAVLGKASADVENDAAGGDGVATVVPEPQPDSSQRTTIAMASPGMRRRKSTKQKLADCHAAQYDSAYTLAAKSVANSA